MPGTVLGIFEDNRYKSESKKSVFSSVDIIGLGTGPELEKKLKYAGDVSSGIIFGRELVNSPANVLTPGLYETIVFVYISLQFWAGSWRISLFLCCISSMRDLYFSSNRSVLDNLFISGVLAEEASNIASAYSDVFTATILNAEQCKELKMGSYLGVAAASENPPHFIHLCYKPPTGPVNIKLALVGKGLTFDRYKLNYLFCILCISRRVCSI